MCMTFDFIFLKLNISSKITFKFIIMRFDTNFLSKIEQMAITDTRYEIAIKSKDFNYML